MSLQHFQSDSHIYYITCVVYDRLPLFCTPTFIIPLIDSLNFYRYKQSFKLLGYVIMPDHIHLLIQITGQATLADIMRDYKEFTAKRIIRQAEVEDKQEWLKAFQEAGQITGRSEQKVWQDSYWDKSIFSVRFLREKLNYIHRNPVRAGLVESPELYWYSSYRNYQYGEECLIAIDKDWVI